ncbi:MAG TPA: RluA family pseudouridine synthase [Candidatus Tumulicola sp.]|nr:RluA family pseudouridine synthase [Candidatus Tumulicola sp.]
MLHAVTADEAGKRADVLVARLSGASRALVAQAVRRGDVRVNGVVSKAARALEAGEILEFELPEPTRLEALPERIDVPVVYEDEDVLVVDKPAGMVTHPAHGTTGGTLVNALLDRIGPGLPGDALRPGLVHRLDRDTSGLLVVAKTAEALRTLGRAMKARRIERQYLGLVCGVPEHERGTVEGAIGRDPRNRLKYSVTADGKPATTHYELREAFARHAELAFRLETGRTHQIRVHLSAMGHPLVNDRTYGRADARFELPGQALHAWRLSFAHPRTGAALAFEAEPPPAYRRARDLLRDDG